MLQSTLIKHDLAKIFTAQCALFTFFSWKFNMMKWISLLYKMFETNLRISHLHKMFESNLFECLVYGFPMRICSKEFICNVLFDTLTNKIVLQAWYGELISIKRKIEGLAMYNWWWCGTRTMLCGNIWTEVCLECLPGKTNYSILYYKIQSCVCSE